MRRFFSVTMLWVLLLPHAIYRLGEYSNQLVLIANHDRFPVMLRADDSRALHAGVDGVFDDTGHCVMTSETHLNFLADIFDYKEYTESIGDKLLEFGVWLNTFAPFVWGALVIRKLYGC